MADVAMTVRRYHTRNGVIYNAGDTVLVPEAEAPNLVAQGMVETTVDSNAFDAEFLASRTEALADGRGWQGNQSND